MTAVSRTALGVLLAGTEAAVGFDAPSGRTTIDANLTRPSADYLEFGTPVVHLVQYLLGFGRWRMTQTQMTAHLADKIGITETGKIRARRAQRVGKPPAQERGLAAPGRPRGIP
jgi:hypothetical protein